MEIEAIYDQGRLEFISPIHLKNRRIRVKVEIPDEEIEENTFDAAKAYKVPEGLKRQAREMLDRLAAVRNAPLPPDSELPELTPKQEKRIKAFALREEIKRMR